MKQEIKTDKAPKAIGPYSQGIISGNMIYTSGSLPINPETGEMPEGIEAQALQALNNCLNIIIKANGKKENIVKVMIFMENLDNFQTVNKVYEDFFDGTIYPARSCVEVRRLPRNAPLEIEMIAEL